MIRHLNPGWPVVFLGGPTGVVHIAGWTAQVPTGDWHPTGRLPLPLYAIFDEAKTGVGDSGVEAMKRAKSENANSGARA